MKPTKKKKNNYIVKISDFGTNKFFEFCKNTPLAVIEINGQPVQHANGWLKCTEFPNPGASIMSQKFDTLKDIMGERLASTIVEYLDKETNEPVVLLYPTNHISYKANQKDYLSRLNHASRKDLKYQLEIRQKFLEKLNQNQK